MSDPALWPATRQAEAIRNREISSRELLDRYVQRAARINPTVNAIVTQDLDAARRAAAEADEAVSRGDPLGPLHGLPITIKDALETAGMRSTAGAVEFGDYVPTRDAPAVSSLKKAGAIVMGKSNTPRYSASYETFNELFGTTVNPWSAELTTGGSSGGAAAAVATGLTSFELGTDIAGSIRIPSAFCGVFGHKPSFGIVPSTGYLDHETGGTTEADINVVGPIARSAADLELLLSVIARDEPPLVTRLAPPPDDLTSLRVCAWLDDPFCPVDREMGAALSAAATGLEASGVAVDRDARPALKPGSATNLGGWLIQAAMRWDVGHLEWLDRDAERQAVRARWAEFFTRYDAALLPVSFVPAFPHDRNSAFMTSSTLECNGEARPASDLGAWSILVGMAYLPATVSPIGLSASGLPIGIQVVGPYGADLLTIRLAGRLSEISGGLHAPSLAELSD